MAVAVWNSNAGNAILSYTCAGRCGNGWLAGVWINETRIGNVAPQALTQSIARDDVSAKLNDLTNNRTWDAWSNGESGAAQVVSQEHPEIITLTCPRPVTLSGMCFLWTGFAEVEVDADGRTWPSKMESDFHSQPKPSETYHADLGVLRGANGQTTQRVYCSNKATAITADVPSEAELRPDPWGKWKIVAEVR